ncbi:hypothetical protein Verru16b_00931 [Lacunisphaera limnophila]|uniref:DinB superfamily protein n=1 Tax=Lacunisphaera limnophila TaxID=1838286 RepID=A0A1D8ASJ7_9BACT|nr:DinB family protein [Lacunisphaera limnophila]AOS43873.1 hypothetical protein Verru16b_00931 [Lacunisphaera limnophila]
MTSLPPTSPRLAPPGAGLPKPELLVANLMFHGGRMFTGRGQAEAMIHAECDALIALAGDCDPAAGARPVLIPRLPGLEDSSRHWSVFMTLEHLRIVNAAVTETIGLLAAGQIPAQPASTAAVKPAPGIDARVIKAFGRGCNELTLAAAAVPELRTAHRFPHPWFGPLDAAGWYFLAAFHLRLHRRQVETILRHLALKPTAAA